VKTGFLELEVVLQKFSSGTIIIDVIKSDQLKHWTKVKPSNTD